MRNRESRVRTVRERDLKKCPACGNESLIVKNVHRVNRQHGKEYLVLKKKIMWCIHSNRVFDNKKKVHVKMSCGFAKELDMRHFGV